MHTAPKSDATPPGMWAPTHSVTDMRSNRRPPAVLPL
jgi:hypothetical protein